MPIRRKIKFLLQFVYKPALIILLGIVMPFVTHGQANALFNELRTYQTMSQRWELDPADKRGTFVITPYKPVYITAGRRSNNPNSQPTSENPLYSLPYRVEYNNYEAKFQLSFKTKALQGIFGGYGDLWIGYTQKAHWQLYNTKLSRLFRELNYEPEVMLNFATNIPLAGFTAKMLGVSFNHQSNGRDLPLSRSWNRIIFYAGWERKHWQVYLRPWIRLKDEEDENPAIADFTGRGEAIIIRNLRKHQLSFVGAHSLRSDKNRGSAQVNWVFPVWKNLKGQLQLSEGYGETLIDYNHRQFTVGISVSLMEW